MNVDSILLSEFAKTDAQGKLTVVGAFNRLSGPGPTWSLPFFSISLVVHGHSAEASTHHTGEIRVINERREEVTEAIEFSFQFSSIEDEGMPLRLVQTLTIIGVQFPEPGLYAFEVFIDRTYHASASLYIRKSDG